MTQNPVASAINQAVLSDSLTDGFRWFAYASLSSSLSADADGWYQLLPTGAFKSRDGSPHDTDDGFWHLDDVSGPAFIEATKAAAPKILIDYEHATLTAKQTGNVAPAAAWLTSATDIEWRPGKGVYIRPDFTAKAKQLIDDKEIGFFSAVFPYDKQGRPLFLRMAALTNDPGLVNLEPVAALTATADLSISLHSPDVSANLYGKTGDHVLNELLKQMLEKLGITLSGDLTEAQSTAALSALDALKTAADSSAGLQTQVATLSAQKEPDLTQFVPITAYNSLVDQIAVLSANSTQTSLDKVISDAKQAGKVLEAESEYLTQFGKQQGVAALSAMLEKRPAIAALTATQTQSKQPPEDHKKEGELSDAELAVLSATGLTEAQYLAAKKEDK